MAVTLEYVSPVVTTKKPGSCAMDLLNIFVGSLGVSWPGIGDIFQSRLYQAGRVFENWNFINGGYSL